MSRLWVGNVAPGTREEELRSFFADSGSVRQVIVKSGFAFVEYDDEASATAAKNDLNGKQFMGRALNIDRATAKPRRDASSSGGYGEGGSGGYDDRRGGYDSERRGEYNSDKRYDDRRESKGHDDRRGGYDDRRGGDRYDDRRGDRYDDRRGGYDDNRGDRYGDRRGDRYDDRRGDRYDDRRGGYDDDKYGGYERRDRYDDRRGDRRPRNSAPYSTTWTANVEGLPHGTRWDELKDHFNISKQVTYANVDAGLGIVHFKDEAALNEAIKSFDQTSFKGSTIRVSRAPSSSGTNGSSAREESDRRRSPSPDRSYAEGKI